MPWRLLEEDENIQAGDERWSSVWSKWKPVPESWVGSTNRLEPIRRRFTQEEPQQWQPIETAPKDGTIFWAYQDLGRSCECSYNFKGDETDRWHNLCANRWCSPTHWMPLPPAPADQLGRAVPLADASPPSVAETEKHPPLQLPKEEEL